MYICFLGGIHLLHEKELRCGHVGDESVQPMAVSAESPMEV